ncbi:MAG: glycosyltransferase family 39 protein [Oscillospiraceae bacterium]|nr:glycosyltransferase family 39 protein [Oscillospiraceae bacterium]
MTTFNLISTTLCALLIAFAFAIKAKERGILSGSLKTGERLTGTADKLHCPALLLILALAAFTSLYKLTEIPAGVNIDEAGVAYDAYCLVNYGVDRWLYRYPVYFINHGRGMSAVYTYMTALNIKLFGFSMFSVRLFNAALRVAQTLAVYSLFKIVKGKRSALFASLLSTLLPIFFMVHRYGVDGYPLLAFFIIALSLLCQALKAGGLRRFALAGLAFGAALYSYALSYLMIPVFLLLTLLCLIRCRKVSLKQALALTLPLLLLAAPLIAELMVNQGLLPEIRSFISFPKLPAYAGDELSPANIPSTFLQSWQLFFNNSIPHSAIAPYYTLYLMSIPLVAAGFFLEAKDAVKALKGRRLDFSLIALSAFLASYGTGLLVGGFNITRLISVFAPLLWFIVCGARFVWRRLGLLFMFIPALYCALALSFYSYYFTSYNEDNYPIIYFDAGATELYRELREKYPDSFMYFLTYRAGATYTDSYIYALLGGLTSPYDFNASYIAEPENSSYGYNRFYIPVREIGGEIIYEVYENCVYVVYLPTTGETIDSLLEKLDESSLVREERYPYAVYSPQGLGQ